MQIIYKLTYENLNRLATVGNTIYASTPLDV